jgi:excisionase family DNA binding protein
MEQNITLQDFLKEFFEPIIDDCINRAIVKFMSVLPQESPDDPDVLDVAEAAKYLMIAKATLYKKVQRREVIHYKQGKRLYFHKKDLNVWIDKGRIKTQDEINEEAEQYIKRKGRYYRH